MSVMREVAANGFGKACVSAKGELRFSNGVNFMPGRDYGQIEDLYARIKSVKEWAYPTDRRELMIAVEELKGYCSSGWKERETLGKLDGLNAELERYWGMFDDHYQAILKTKDNPQTLLTTTYQDWDDVITRLTAVGEKISGLSIDGWQGEAADTYRSGLQPRIQDVEQTKALAISSRNGIEGVAQVQAIILMLLQNTMLKLLTRDERNVEKFRKDNELNEASLRDRFKNSYWDFKLNNQEAYSYPFFVRTQTMVHYIKWLAEEVDHNITDVRNGAWVPNSENLSDYLKHAVEQTRAGQTADNSGYRKPDEVPDRPGSGPDKANARGEHMEH